MLEELGQRAKAAAGKLALIPENQKNAALAAISDHLWVHRAEILSANALDVDNGRKSGLSEALIDRLLLDGKRLDSIIRDLVKVISLNDPVGNIFDQQILENGLNIKKITVPIGVLGVIYESRPNVTVDVTGLSLKSGNSVVLRGGKETIASNRAIVTVIQVALNRTSIPVDAVQFIDSPDRRIVDEMLRLHQYIDMLIPRGSQTLHQYCRENSQIPVMTGGIGICHLFVDESARLDESLKVVRNAKIQRPSVCNALDTLLVHRDVAKDFIPFVVNTLKQDGVAFRISPKDLQFIRDEDLGAVSPASEGDFDQEWLALILGIKVVDSLDEAMVHIQEHSTGHSDGILTENESNANTFVSHIDSAVVYVNASTRFTDGSQMGLGAEVAVSTQKLHARGPMALKALTTYKWVVNGEYHVRE